MKNLIGNKRIYCKSVSKVTNNVIRIILIIQIKYYKKTFLFLLKFRKIYENSSELQEIS